MSRDPSSIPPLPRSARQSGRRADPFASLNDEQRAAATHGLGQAAPAPLLVIAGAGTGKTMTLAARVAQLVLAGADPQRLLLLTFSRRAALGMAQRSGALLQAALGLPSTLPPPALPWCGTFHAIGARLLREQAPRIGLPEDYTILDRADAEELMGLVREQLGHAAARRRFPLKGTCLAIASRVVNSGATVEQVVGRHFPWCLGWEDELRTLLRDYVREKQQHCLDYDDLLLYWHAMLVDAALAAALGARWDHVLVDEFQDTNRMQAEILHALKPDGRGLTVVGDDAQSIYGFRAAEVRNILDFPSRYEPPARVITLTRNYRSTQPILDLANTVIAGALEGHRKALRSERAGPRPQLVTVEDDTAQARWVADAVLAEREAGVALKRQAVLFRTGHHSAALELARRDIPFVKFPSDMATGSDAELDEERRLLYVGLTRARQRLAVLTPQRYYVAQQGGGGPRHLYAAPSRFLDPAAAALCEPSAPRSHPPAAPVDSATPSDAASLRNAESSVPDLLARVRDRF